jgi:hypothetical protein
MSAIDRVTILGDFFANWATFGCPLCIDEAAKRNGDILGYFLLKQIF